MAITQFHHMALCVRDLARSVAFYRDLLGFRVAGELTLEGPAVGRLLGSSESRAQAVFMARDGIRVELVSLASAGDAPAPSPVEGPRVGFAHLTFSVDDLASTLQSLRDRGVTVLGETRSDLGPGMSACMILDPDALPIELYQHPAGVASPYDALD